MTMYGFNAFLRIAPETGTYADSGSLGTPIDTRLNSSSLIMDQEKNRKTNLSVPASGMLASMYDGFFCQKNRRVCRAIRYCRVNRSGSQIK